MRLACVDDLVVLNLTPDFERLLLALFFLTADERNDVIYHLRPGLKGLACAGNCLICADENVLNLVACLVKRINRRNIALK